MTRKDGDTAGTPRNSNGAVANKRAILTKTAVGAGGVSSVHNGSVNSALPHSPAADRNKGPILDRLRALLPVGARVLEIASGTGQHAEHFALASRSGGWGWQWQPSEATPAGLLPLAERLAEVPGVRPPVVLDVRQPDWPVAAGGAGWDAIYVANLLHISPWTCTGALMRGAARGLRPGGRLIVYGPFIVEGEPTSPSNQAFDIDLRSRDAAWGLRHLSDVQDEARAAGLGFEALHDMPAHNRLLVFGRPAG